MKIGLIVLISKKPITLLSNQEIKVINATAKMTPGIAQPETEKVVNDSKNLLFEIRFPQFEMKAKNINTQQDKNTNKIVFKKRFVIFKSVKCFGKIIVQ